jgi:hypothetical protein
MLKKNKKQKGSRSPKEPRNPGWTYCALPLAPCLPSQNQVRTRSGITLQGNEKQPDPRSPEHHQTERHLQSLLLETQQSSQTPSPADWGSSPESPPQRGCSTALPILLLLCAILDQTHQETAHCSRGKSPWHSPIPEARPSQHHGHPIVHHPWAELLLCPMLWGQTATKPLHQPISQPRP